MRRFMSCKDVAEIYDVKVITVWEWIRKGKLPALKIGKQYRITQNDLVQLEQNFAK